MMGRHCRIFKNLMLLTLIALSGAGAKRLSGQTINSGFVYGGLAFGSGLNGAGRFGVGLDFGLTSKLDLGGELGLIAKNDVGPLGSTNLYYHFTPHERGRTEWDPFLVGGFTAAHLHGATGAYLNLGAGVNYWWTERFALRGEFKGYAGGQDLGGFGELRFGLTFRP